MFEEIRLLCKFIKFVVSFFFMVSCKGVGYIIFIMYGIYIFVDCIL